MVHVIYLLRSLSKKVLRFRLKAEPESRPPTTSVLYARRDNVCTAMRTDESCLDHGS
jgi:hypothetical protein